MKQVDYSKLNVFKSTKVMLHAADPKLAYNHITYWLEKFQQSNINFSILVRNINSYHKLIKEYPSEQILYANAPIDVETIVNKQPDLKIVFYTANLAKNIHLLRFNHLTHIFIGSKNSDYLSKINKSFRAYDEIWVSSQYMIDKFKDTLKNIGHLEFKIIGKPQLKEILSRKNHKDSKFITLVSKKGTISISSWLDRCISYSEVLQEYKFFAKDDNTSYTANIKRYNIEQEEDVFSKSSYFVVDRSLEFIPLLAYGVPLLMYGDPFEELKVPFASYFLDCQELSFSLEKVDSMDGIQEYFLGKSKTLDNAFLKALHEFI